EHIKDSLSASNSKTVTSSQGLTIKRVNLYYTATDLSSAYYFRRNGIQELLKNYGYIGIDCTEEVLAEINRIKKIPPKSHYSYMLYDFSKISHEKFVLKYKGPFNPNALVPSNLDLPSCGKKTEKFKHRFLKKNIVQLSNDRIAKHINPMIKKLTISLAFVSPKSESTYTYNLY
ncbi:2717_t:CDS:2, partial [Cetraspora pellucida]